MGLSDAYVYKYRFGETKYCLIAYEAESYEIQDNLDAVYGDSEVK